MLQFLLFFVLISGALNDKALINGVKNTLGECSDIVEAVGDFLAIFEERNKNRRRKSSLGVAVTKKLKTCGAILDTVNAFRQRHFSPMVRGKIALQLDEARFLSNALKGVSKKMGKTLYIASKGGDASSKFHARCDGKGPTVVIVQSTTGAVFGGYSDQNWKHKGWVKSTKSFLFRLRPSMTRYKLKSGQERYAIYAYNSFGPTFGRGHDLHISSSALGNTKSYTNAGGTYVFPSNPNHQLNDGTKKFQSLGLRRSRSYKVVMF